MTRMTPTRRTTMLGLSALGMVSMVSPLQAQTRRERLVIAAAAPGSVFLAYAQGIGKVVAGRSAIDLEPRHTAGSNENIRLVDANEAPLGTVNMGPGFDAWNGTGPFAGGPLRRLRALFPMYETPFHTLVSPKAGIRTLRDLNGRRVGVGPAKGPGEVFFLGMASALGISATVVNGEAIELGDKVAAGEIDAFWFGGGTPMPAFKKVTDGGQGAIIGFTDEESELFRKRFAYFAPYTIPAGTYAGQREPLNSCAVWNFVCANAALPDDVVYELVKAVMDHPAEIKAAHPAAGATALANVGANTFMPFHPGAVRYYREKSVTLRRDLAEL